MFLFLLLLLIAPCSSTYINHTTTSSLYEEEGVVLITWVSGNPTLMRQVVDVVLEYSIHTITSYDIKDKILTFASSHVGFDRLKDTLEAKEIKMDEIIEIDHLPLDEGHLQFESSMHLVNNTDPDLYDLGKIWDLDTIYNFINHTASQEPWMEVLELGLTHLNNPIQAIKVDRYPKSPWGSRKVHVLMGPWEGNEWVALKSLLAMLDKVSKYAHDIYDPVHPLVTRNVLYIIPLPNPDGYQHSITTNRLWPKNLAPVSDEAEFSCVGVNLEFNARSTVEEDLADKVCDLEFDGAGPYLQAEVAAILNFSVEVLANTSREVHWFQLQDYSHVTLVPPFSEESTGEALLILGDILSSFNVQTQALYNLNYTLDFGVSRLFPSVKSHFLDTLIEGGVTGCFSVGIPLSLEQFIMPVGAEGAELAANVSADLIRALDPLTTSLSTIQLLTPIIRVVLLGVPVAILIFTMGAILFMMEDTKEMQLKRAGKTEEVPGHVRVAGDLRQYTSKVIKSGVRVPDTTDPAATELDARR